MKQLALFLFGTIYFFVFQICPLKSQDLSGNYYSGTTFDVGISVGAMNCLSDLGGNQGIGKQTTKDLNIGKTHPSVGGYLSCLYKNTIGFRLEANFGSVSADDAVLKSVPITDISSARYNRNLNFKSKINEYSLLAEIYPKNLFTNKSEKESFSAFSPYVLAGVGFYSYNPQGSLNGKLIDLQPLRTEGQGFLEDRQLYKLNQTNIPVGIGLKYDISPIVKIRTEIVYRFLTTDYLDDVSTRYVSTQIYGGEYQNISYMQQAVAYGFIDANGSTTVNYDNVLNWYSQGSNFDLSDADGKKRGDPTHNDSYFSFNVKVGILLGRSQQSY